MAHSQALYIHALHNFKELNILSSSLSLGSPDVDIGWEMLKDTRQGVLRSPQNDLDLQDVQNPNERSEYNQKRKI